MNVCINGYSFCIVFAPPIIKRDVNAGLSQVYFRKTADLVFLYGMPCSCGPKAVNHDFLLTCFSNLERRARFSCVPVDMNLCYAYYCSIFWTNMYISDAMDLRKGS